MKSGIARRHVRVFVSSTFHDLKQERELLTRETFPAIREAMAKRQVTVNEIDLRWGITAEDAEQGRVLQICLEEIDRCRPYFIGIVGSRYGSKVAIDEETIARFDWLRGKTDRSITELEFIHGALNSPASADRSLFYVRSDAEAPESSGRLKELVRRIEKAGVPLRRDWCRADELATLLADDLRGLLEKDFPEETLDADDLIRAQHAYFAADAAATYVANEDNLARLRRLVESDEPPLVITGEPGSGKTALLAVFSESQASHSTFVHFVGPVADSTDPIRLMGRLLRWLVHTMNIDVEAEVSAAELADSIDAAFTKLPEGRRITVIIDAVDLLDDVAQARLFVWLPRRPPANVRLIVSCQSEAVIEAAQRRLWNVHSLSPLDTEQRERIAQRYLQPHGKSLDRAQLEVVANSPQAGNLLFLQSVLTELRLFGSFDRLDAQLETLLGYRDTEELLEKVLERLEEEDEAGTRRRLLETLRVSHSGVSEDELMAMVETGDGPASLDWVITRRALDAHVVEQAGRIRISSQALRSALARHYFTDAAREATARLRLVEFYRKLPALRRVQELPAQLVALGQDAELFEFLIDIDNFRAFPVEELTRPQLQHLWLRLPARDPVAGYVGSFEEYVSARAPPPDTQVKILNELGLFLGELSRHDGAAEVYQRALGLAIGIHGEGSPATAVFVNNVGHALLQKGDADAARVQFQRAIELSESAKEPDYELIGSFLDNLAQTLRSPGEATEAFRRAFELREKVLGPRAPATLRSLHNLAQAVYKSGDMEAAERLAREVVDRREDVLGWDNLNVAISRGMLATILLERQEFPEMSALLASALPVYERQRGHEHPTTLNLRNLTAVALLRQSRGAEAEPLLEELVEHFRDSDNQRSPFAITVLHNLGVARKQQGRPQDALSLVEEALRLEEANTGADSPQALTFRNTLAGILHDLARRDDAERTYRHVLEKRRETIGALHVDTARTLHELGALLLADRPAEAAEMFEQAAHIRSDQLGAGHPLTMESQEMLVRARGDSSI